MHCIADANVLLPLLTDGHAHQAPARSWWEACEDDTVGLTLPVRMALLRSLSDHRVMGSSTLRPSRAWGAVQRLIDDPRVSFVDSLPSTHAGLWLGNVARREPTPDLWTDAWLAVVAQAHDWEMTTFDRGFRAFAKLKLHLLDPAG